MKGETLRMQCGDREVAFLRGGQGAPLLYLHSMLGLRGWEPVLEVLAASFDVIAPWAPGWGPLRDGDGLDGALDVALHARDVLTAAGVDRAHVVGVSIGAWMAAELAAIFPERVASLALVNPVGLWLDDAPGADPFAQHPARPSEALFSDPALREPLLLAGRNPEDAYVEELLALKASARFLWPIPDTGVRRRLGRIAAPTLIVTSEGDRIVPPAHGPAWQRRIAGARLAVLPGAGHVADLEQPEALARIAVAFVGEAAAEGRREHHARFHP
jgi:pimeloyl-ACP methyl ester carboxylesterase